MVAINVNEGQNDQIPDWKAEGNYTFPVLVGASFEMLRDNYGGGGTPTNLILDSEGRIVFKHLGYSEGGEKVLEAEIRELLGLNPFATEAGK